jgi:hypothetical protein
VDENLIKKNYLREILGDVMGWIHVGQGEDQW